MLFTKPKKAIGLDIGTHSVKAVQVSRSGGRLCVDEVGYARVDRNELNANPVGAHAGAVNDALRPMSVVNSLLVAALPGQTAVIRYPRLNEAARNDMERAIEREAGQSIPYDLSEVFLDWAVLDEVEEGEQHQLKVLLVAAKHEIIDSRVQIFETADIQCGVLSVDSLSLADAAECCGFLQPGETVALIHIGMTSASIHFVKDGVSNFIRDVNWGSRELIQAIAKERRCEFEEAEQALRDSVQQDRQMTESGMADVADVPEALEAVEGAETAETLEEAPEALESPGAEEDPFGELGDGGSLLDPLDEELGGEVSRPAPPAPAAAGPQAGPEQRDLAEVLAQPLGRMVSEIRRSFDFYEHQLYERPVDRVLLSGGVAHVPLVRDTLLEELGMDAVEIADPTQGQLILGDDIAMGELLERPAQFMVAIGLAARGMADL